MAVQTLNIYPYSFANADFRQWGLAISNALAAAGLVKTADTGQIDWTTVLATNANLQKRGYEVWRFNDALQATRPVFIRIDYGSGNYPYNPMLWFTIGTATDGAGNPTAHASFPNALMTARTVLSTTSSAYVSTSTAPVYVDSDGAGSLMIAGWFSVPGSSNPTFSGFVGIVERTRNFDGTYNGEGVTFMSAIGTGGTTTQTVIITNAPFYSAQPLAFNGAHGLYPWYGTGNAPVPNVGYAGGIQYFYPVFTGFTPQMHGPSKHVVGMLPNDMPVLSQVDINHYGVLKHWVVGSPTGVDYSNTLRVVVRVT